ncbi:MAG TPA: class I SAM-dependent methyltransferase [Acidimicrobiia bacterium]
MRATGSEPVFDRIGVGYARRRRADPRIAAHITAALGEARAVLDVGAGTGSYEQGDREWTAIDPSRVMIDQRPRGSAPVVQGVAEALPFPDDTFDAATAILTLQHWSDPAAGMAEVRRVARRQVILTWDARFYAETFWLLRDYLPEVAEWERTRATFETACELLPGCRTAAVPVPYDCVDGFGAAYWRRPEAYLDAEVRGSISGIALLGDGVAERAMRQLRGDLESGTWHRRNEDLLEVDELDVGYRLVVAER